MFSSIVKRSRPAALRLHQYVFGLRGPAFSLAEQHGDIHTSTPLKDGKERNMISSLNRSIIVQEISKGTAYGILFDDKYPLKTPAKKPFIVPSKPLAHGIAAEWMWQKDNRVVPDTMPLMSLAATAIDEPQSGETISSSLCSFLPTDPVLCREEDDASKRELSIRQESILRPYIEFVNAFLVTELRASTSIMGAPISRRDVQIIHEYISGLDSWRRSALMELSSACKSVCMAIAGVEGNFTSDDLMAASRIEEDYQIQQWGLVEGGHDVDLADAKVRIQSPLVFLDLLQIPK